VSKTTNRVEGILIGLAANYCPVVVGSLGGARWGVGSIGHRMLQHCEILPRVRLAASSLAKRWP
jgi:hypothetical protein